MTNQIIQEMFDSAVHIGHRTRKWNPRMKKYIFGKQSGLHIINLEKTAKMFETALNFMAKLRSEGKKVLFVSTKPQSVHLVEEMAQNLGMPYVTNKWIPGLLTNFPTIKTRIKYLSDLKNQEETGEFAKYTKKEASTLKKTIQKLEIALGGVQNMKDMPDCVFVVDTVRDKIVVEEARKLNIPVVGFVDTNADPLLVDYPIPANDDALKSLKYLFSKIEDNLKKPSKTQ